MMRLLPTLDCRPGMKLGKPVYTPEGNVLLGYRVELNPHIIQRLYTLGYEYVYIEDPQTDDIFIEDAIRIETRMAVRTALTKVCQVLSATPSAVADGRISLNKICAESVTSLIRDLAEGREDTIMMMSVPQRSGNRIMNHFIQNAVNVSVYATKLGMLQGYYGEELAALTIGAMLHDVGNFGVNPELLLKPAPLTEEEFEEVKKHTSIGFDMLRNQPGIPTLAATCALHHHERIDGSGYFGLQGNAIHPFAQWVGLLDTYDALTHPRAYRQAYLPHEAMELLYISAATSFDRAKIELFRNKVAIFPVGLSVSLSTGEQGIVSKLNPSCKHRPIVRVLQDPSGSRLKSPYEVDLSSNLSVMIDRIGEELAALA